MKVSQTAVFSAYAAALVQGLTLVSFPASGVVLKSQHGISDSQFGLIFVPQVIAAIIGSIASGSLAEKLGLKQLLWLALLANALSQVGLASLSFLANDSAFAVLMGSTAAMGFGFGLMGPPMNSFPTLFFPNKASTALVAMHSLNGAGLAIGPLLLSGLGATLGWVAFPLSLAGLAAALAALTIVTNFTTERGQDPEKPGAAEPSPLATGAFWTLAGIAVIYAFAEGSFSNWAVVYLQEGKHLSAAVAGAGLSTFWSALVAGRLIVSLLVLRVPVRVVWRTLPFLMALAFAVLPYATTPVLGIAAFALAGFGCSAFFPLTVSLATLRFPRHLSWVSALMIAALMTGVGIGTFSLGLMHANLPFETLYRLSMLYPALALALSFLVPADPSATKA